MKKTNKNANMGMMLGMCFGVSIGTSLGVAFDGNTSLGTSIGLAVGMAVGTLLGYLKDKEVNAQINERGYIIKTIEDNTVTIVDKNNEEKMITVPQGQMDEEHFEVGDVVFLDEDGMIEQAFDKEDE